MLAGLGRGFGHFSGKPAECQAGIPARPPETYSAEDPDVKNRGLNYFQLIRHTGNEGLNRAHCI